MQKANKLIIRTLLRLRIQQRKSRRGESLHLRQDVRHFERDMMHALTPLVDVLADHTLGPRPLHKFDLRLPLPEEGCIHLFARDLLGLVTGRLQQGLEKGDADPQVFNGNADMFDFEHD